MDNDALDKNLTKITEDDEGWMYFDLICLFESSEIGQYMLLI